MPMLMTAAPLLLVLLCLVTASSASGSTMTAFSRSLNLSQSSNLVIYWGQDCLGTEPSLAELCTDAAYDVIILSFLDRFGNGTAPHLDLASHCTDTFPHSHLLHCPQVGLDISACQARGKTLLLSMGGADGRHSFSSAADANSTAHWVYSAFFGGSSEQRPFDSAVLDGIDLDIENNLPAYYADFITTLRALWSADTARSASTPYLMSAAPQCVYPDASLGPDRRHHNVTVPTAISHAWFDFLNLQFYNNDCGVAYYGSKAFHFRHWAEEMPAVNPNRDIKLMLGIAAGPTAAEGYVNATRMAEIIAAVRELPQFAGIMMWDDNYAKNNSNFQTQIKKILLDHDTGTLLTAS